MHSKFFKKYFLQGSVRLDNKTSLWALNYKFGDTKFNVLWHRYFLFGGRIPIQQHLVKEGLALFPVKMPMRSQLNKAISTKTCLAKIDYQPNTIQIPQLRLVPWSFLA